MDFDKIIVFLFVMAFFVLPSLIKQILARKKKTAAPKTIKKNPSIIDRIGEQIRQFVKDLEEQARQQKEGIKEQDTGWETLAEDEESPPVFESVGEDADFREPEPKEVDRPLKKRIHSRRSVQEPYIKEPLYPLREKYCFKFNPLQNAVIWSEILSKPLALKDK
ncbi:hypothetical protein [Desulfobacula sp.]|uniref:hypothetical protein n=1 Tax=Desulfobacula sp. TaxID=2593537 RepID=UPI0026099BC5|nr:hypothetical protein [Desulfobacula sp.]